MQAIQKVGRPYEDQYKKEDAWASDLIEFSQKMET